MAELYDVRVWHMTKEHDTSSARRRRHPALDVRIPFFKPLWRRVLTSAVMVLWIIVELVYGSPYWAALAAGICAYVGYQFFVAFDLDERR
ncbi:hypothetical protein [Tropicimonas sp. S265A]|uniref:hypothetical protein n=1 Tax=Tropicimonas sp. S265A TaxID=3415134 RepID=UPI003C7DC6AE